MNRIRLAGTVDGPDVLLRVRRTDLKILAGALDALLVRSVNLRDLVRRLPEESRAKLQEDSAALSVQAANVVPLATEIRDLVNGASSEEGCTVHSPAPAAAKPKTYAGMKRAAKRAGEVMV